MAFDHLRVLNDVGEQFGVVGQISHGRVVQDLLLDVLSDCLERVFFDLLQLVEDVGQQSEST